MPIDREFWKGRKVLITGHTGFKGATLTVWLHRLGATVSGLALDPPSTPSLFEEAECASLLRDVRADIRDLGAVQAVFETDEPEVVFHLAAQPLVRASYGDPIGTYATNVMGTLNLMEAARRAPCVRSIVIVTTDKVYENREWVWPYRESDELGGFDPYASSKACAELAVASFRRSFLHPERPELGVATARAGNVIGGGDWAQDRIVPDLLRAWEAGETVTLRSPNAIRPWQHVLEPLSGYMQLAHALWKSPREFSEPWNFGPDSAGNVSVLELVRILSSLLGGPQWEVSAAPAAKETMSLRLDAGKAAYGLGWKPTLDFPTTLTWIANWHRARRSGCPVRDLVLRDIEEFEQINR